MSPDNFAPAVLVSPHTFSRQAILSKLEYRGCIMSNVLIGIIGVILFIGLALAGALFLGSRFQEASSVSKAAAVMQAISQVRQAREMYELQEGKPYKDVNIGELVSQGYLKSRPDNPIGAQMVSFATNAVNAPVSISGSEGSTEVCKIINREMHNGDVVLRWNLEDSALGPTSSGCWAIDPDAPEELLVIAY